MNKAFIVCGPESSGNRLMGAILCRAGCWGSGSTEQPSNLDDIPKDEKLLMIIKHHYLAETYNKLKSFGYEVTAIMVIREWFANINSLIQRKHDNTIEEAEMRIKTTIQENITDSLENNIPLIVFPYESITNDSIRNLLDKLGLKSDNLNRPLDLKGQEYPDQTYFPKPLTENRKHYPAAPQPRKTPKKSSIKNFRTK